MIVRAREGNGEHEPGDEVGAIEREPDRDGPASRDALHGRRPDAKGVEGNAEVSGKAARLAIAGDRIGPTDDDHSEPLGPPAEQVADAAGHLADRLNTLGRSEDDDVRRTLPQLEALDPTALRRREATDLRLAAHASAASASLSRCRNWVSYSSA